MRPPAPPKLTHVSANAWQMTLTHTDAAGQGFFEMASRFGLNAPHERPHMFLTPLARAARWAGFYVRGHDAIGATVGFTILTGMAAMHHDLAVRAADDVCYTQILNLV